MGKYVFFPAPDIIGVGKISYFEKALYGKIAFDDYGRFIELDACFVWLSTKQVFFEEDGLSKGYLRRWNKSPMHYIVDLLLDELEFKYLLNSKKYPSDEWVLKEVYENKLYLSLKTLEQNYKFRKGGYL